MYILIIALYLIIPALVIYGESRYPIIQKIGAVVLCYIAGLIIGNSGMVPPNFRETQESLFGVTAVLAMPLLLFSMNIRQWFSMAKDTFVSLLLGLASVVIMVFFGFFLFKDQIEHIEMIGGVLTGFYSGGAPNAGAIAYGIGLVKLDEQLYMQAQVYDMLIGAVLLLFMITFAQRFFLLFMKPWKRNTNSGMTEAETIAHTDQFTEYSGIFSKGVLFPLLGAFGLTAVIFGISYAVSRLFPEKSALIPLVLVSTSLGILLSLVPRVRQIKKTFQFGMYLVLVFCVVISSMADIKELVNINWPLFWYVMLAVWGALFLHSLLSWIFKVDADNMIIASVALSMAPPFVPVVAAAIRNKELIMSGILTGVVGYAIGNFLGNFIFGILGLLL